ncbi:MAG: hypothetical protein AB8G17_09750 [Gammaproteobacteria bacterium]
MNIQRQAAMNIWVALSVAFAFHLPTLPAAATERLWHKYESPYFVVYSDTSKRRTQSILNNLELFKNRGQTTFSSE